MEIIDYETTETGQTYMVLSHEDDTAVRREDFNTYAEYLDALRK